MDEKLSFEQLKEALNDPTLESRHYIISELGSLQDPRAIPLLIQIAQDKTTKQSERTHTIYNLSNYDTPETISALQNILKDQSDDPTVRAEAAEQVSYMDGTDSTLGIYIQTLQEENEEIRFWSAFGITTLNSGWWGMDIAKALPVLDELIANDKRILPRWWHIGREPIYAFERQWYRQFVNCIEDEDTLCPIITRLISPAWEYQDFKQRTTNAEGIQLTHRLEEAITLQVNPNWLGQQMREKWLGIQFNVRRTKAYLIDWIIPVEDRVLMGGLHRDGYGVFISGSKAADVTAFALWYRSVIAPEHTLRIYMWADSGVEIGIHMTPEEFDKIVDPRSTFNEDGD